MYRVIIGVILALIGGIVTGIVVGISNTKAIKNNTTGNLNGEGYIVMKGKSSNKLVTNICFICGSAFICFSLPLLNFYLADVSMMIFLGTFLILMGLFFIKSTEDNRIEYNDSEIKQFVIIRKKVRIIKWDDLKSVEYKDIGPLLALRSNETEIFVDLRFDGANQFVEFLSEKFESKYSDGLRSLITYK